jgi:hypothetical protein
MFLFSLKYNSSNFKYFFAIYIKPLFVIFLHPQRFNIFKIKQFLEIAIKLLFIIRNKNIF